MTRLGLDVDYDHNFLARALGLIDAEVSRLIAASKTGNVPSEDIYLDDIEYLIGLGLVACQAYIGHALVWVTDIEKEKALEMGPTIAGEHGQFPIVAVVNAAADYWRYSREWERATKPTKEAKATLLVN